MNYRPEFIAKAFSKIRISRGYSQSDMSQLLNIGRTSYIAYERNERAVPLEVLINASNIFHVPLEYFISDTDEYASSKFNRVEDTLSEYFTEKSIHNIKEISSTNGKTILDEIFSKTHIVKLVDDIKKLLRFSRIYRNSISRYNNTFRHSNDRIWFENIYRLYIEPATILGFINYNSDTKTSLYPCADGIINLLKMLVKQDFDNLIEALTRGRENY